MLGDRIDEVVCGIAPEAGAVNHNEFKNKRTDIRIKKYNTDDEISYGKIEDGELISMPAFREEDIVICDKQCMRTQGFKYNNKLLNIKVLASRLIDEYNRSPARPNITDSDLCDLMNDMTFYELYYFLTDNSIDGSFINIIKSIVDDEEVEGEPTPKYTIGGGLELDALRTNKVTGIEAGRFTDNFINKTGELSIKKINVDGSISFGYVNGDSLTPAYSIAKDVDLVLTNDVNLLNELSNAVDYRDIINYISAVHSNLNIDKLSIFNELCTMDLSNLRMYLSDKGLIDTFIRGFYTKFKYNGSKLKSDVDIEEPVELAKISKDGVITKYDVYLKSGRVVLSKCDNDTPAVILTASSISNGNKQFKAKMITPAVLANFVANNRGCSIFENGMEESISSKSGEDFLVYLDGYNAISALVKLVGTVIEL